MILFLADKHYDSHPGLNMYKKLKSRFDINFFEDDLTPLNQDLSKYELEY